MRFKKGILIMVLLLVVSLIAAGCTGNGKAANEPKGKVTMVTFSWQSSELHNEILSYIIKNGYNYDVELVNAESMPGLLGLDRGEIDIATEVWLDNRKEWWNEVTSKGSIVSAGDTFTGPLRQGWYVPTYVIKGDAKRGIAPIAPNLKSIEDLNQYWELFVHPENSKKGIFYNAPSGWSSHMISLARLESYKITNFESFDPGSSTALDVAITSAYDRGIPVVSYYWEPTWLLGKLDMTLLEEPAHDPALWTKEAGYRCGYPVPTVNKLVNAKFAAANPQINELIKNYKIAVADTNAVLAMVNAEGITIKEAAQKYIKNNDEWKKWVTDKSAVTKITNSLK